MTESNPFSAWIALQLELQRTMFKDPRDIEDPDERASFLIWNAFAATDELHEAMQEVGWKPWATSRHLNSEEFLDELVDALHFIANMVLVASINKFEEPETLGILLWEKYKQKVKINMERQIAGYDGITGKCPICKRATVNGYYCPEHGHVELGGEA